jgi:hypothetical protein|tara:strand:+ start:4534 stop:6711 length:2178 start_codon:yes stop_codon:yes gene_type:complete
MAAGPRGTRGGGRGYALALAILALCALAGSAVAMEAGDGLEDASVSDGDFPSFASPIVADTDGDDDDLPPTSEDVPVWNFEQVVVTIGKASGKERRVETPAFFLRGDDPAAAATRFVYVNSLPISQVSQYAATFSHEWQTNVPDDLKPRGKTRPKRSKPLGPKQYLSRAKEHTSEARDDEAHFDLVRALANSLEDPGSADAADRLDASELAEANTLLEQHHRKHSRALNAADKHRELKEKAHEREVNVFHARKATRANLALDESDFKALWDERYAGPNAEGETQSESAAAHELALHAAVEAKDWDRVIEVAASADRAGVSVPEQDVPLRKLAVARAHWHRNEWRLAERAANAAVASGARNGDWRRGQVRAVAVATGADASVKRGDAEGALKFFAAAKRADPDTPLFSEPYKAIKASEKLLKDADLKLDRGESRQAMESADEAVAKLRGLGGFDLPQSGVGSVTTNHGMFSGADARRCRAHAQARSFEHALEACDRSLKMLGCLDEKSLSSDNKLLTDLEKKVWEKACAAADPKHRARALLARSEVHSRDLHYDGALSDLRAAQELIEPSAQRGSSEAQRMLDEIRQKAVEAERERKSFDNNRDHGKMLDLPENLGELPKDRRCDFIKKAYKKAALKWHPDKAIEAGKTRAARKMNEMTEARDSVNLKFGCVEKKIDPNDPHQGHQGFGQQHQYQQYYQQQQQRQQHRNPGGGSRGGGQFRHSWEF